MDDEIWRELKIESKLSLIISTLEILKDDDRIKDAV